MQRGRGGSELLPPGYRRPAMVLVAAGAAVVAALGVAYHGQHTYGSLDAWVVEELLGPLGSHRRTLWAVEQLASPFSAVTLAVVLAVVACALKEWRCAALSIAGLAATGLLVEALKVVIGRSLFGNLALPSGHTAGATSLAITLAVFVLVRMRPRRVGAGVVALLLVTLVATTVGVAMTALRLHYATDTVAGYGIGLAATLTVALAIDTIADRARASRATAA